MALPALALVDEACVAAVSAGQGEAQGVGVGGNDDEVDVIGHKAIREDLDARHLAPRGDPFAIGCIIGLAEKSLHAAVAALSDMVGNAWNDYAG